MFIKNLILLLIAFFIFCPACFPQGQINAQNNSYIHNNKGLIYLKENYYYVAIKEFQIDIDLNPNSQASAIYYINLGNTYEKIGYPNLAKPCFEKAVQLNRLCFDYYLKMTENYKKLGIVEEKLNQYMLDNSSPLNDIIIGLLYIQSGDVTTGVTVLDEFCNKEPNLLITTGVRAYLDKLTNIEL